MTYIELWILAVMIAVAVITIIVLFMIIVWLFEKAANKWLMLREAAKEVKCELRKRGKNSK